MRSGAGCRVSGRTFFHRQDCPLCEEAWEALQQAGLDHAVERVDISTDAGLEALYGWRIPVLRWTDGREFDLALEAHWQDLYQSVTTVGAKAPI